MIDRFVDRIPAWVIWLFLVIMTCLGVTGYNLQSAQNSDQSMKLSHQDRTLRAQARSITDLAATVREANRRLAEVGAPQVPLPTATTTATPRVIFQQPTAADMNAAVVRYCTHHAGCKGPGASPAQVKTAVRVYCSTGACVGPTGSGTPGPAGPPPTDEQITQAVAAYCAAGACRGRGIAALACSSHSPHGLQIQVTYTDGTTDTITCA